jgi:hypothetical protein
LRQPNRLGALLPFDSGENAINPNAGILKISKQISDRYPFTINADQTEIHFTLNQNSEALSEDEFVEIPEMTEEEFEQSKLDMQLPGNVQFKPDGEPLMQRRFSLVDDHDIAIYIDRLK